MIYGILIVVCIVFGLLGILILRFWFDRRDFRIKNTSEVYQNLYADLKALSAQCSSGAELKREYRIVHSCSDMDEFSEFEADSCWQAYVISHHEFLSYVRDCVDKNQQLCKDMYSVGNQALESVCCGREYHLCQRLLMEMTSSVICDVLFVLEWKLDDKTGRAVYRKVDLDNQLDTYERGRNGWLK